MTTCLGKSCSFGLLCVSFVNIYQILCVCPSFPFGITGEKWDVIVLIPYQCVSIYLDSSTLYVGWVHLSFKCVGSILSLLFFFY